MNIIKFKECNTVYAENQPEYLPLPCHKTEEGQVISCWKLNFRERLSVLLKGKVWFSSLTFNKPLQPQLPMTQSPFIKTNQTP